MLPLYVPHKDIIKRIDPMEVILFEAGNTYTTIITANGSYLSRDSLTELEEMLGPEIFCRVHRSYIVSLHHIHYLQGNIINMGKQDVPLSKNYRDAFRARLIILS